MENAWRCCPKGAVPVTRKAFMGPPTGRSVLNAAAQVRRRLIGAMPVQKACAPP